MRSQLRFCGSNESPTIGYKVADGLNSSTLTGAVQRMASAGIDQRVRVIERLSAERSGMGSQYGFHDRNNKA